MDRTIEKWTREGWEVVSRTQIAKKKFAVTFEYEIPPLTPEERARKRQQNRQIGIGCLGLIILSVLVSPFLPKTQPSRSTAASVRVTTSVYAANQTHRTHVPVSTSTQVMTITKPTEVAVLPSNTSTMMPTATSSSTDRPTATNTLRPRATSTHQLQAVILGSQNVNLRSAASTTASIITSLLPRTTVTIIATSQTGTWYRVVTESGEVGWIASQLLDLNDSGVFGNPPTAQTTISTRVSNTARRGSTFYVIGNGRVNARETTNTNSGVVDTLPYGSSVEVVGEVTGENVSGSTVWYEVLINGEVAYIHGSLLGHTLPPTLQPQQSTPLPNVAPIIQPTLVPPTANNICPNLSANCSELTCTQAYACLAAGNGGLDRDNDGIPCESVCGG
jgi:uncharacterized protein YgiM (DUF1202 family)